MNARTINQITLLLLLIGLGGALAIYRNSNPLPVDLQLEDPTATKKYLREMQMIGGQANMVATEWRAWFASLWRGRALAGTVAFITVGVTLVFRLVAAHPDFTPTNPPDDQTPPP